MEHESGGLLILQYFVFFDEMRYMEHIVSFRKW
jgi:hypothetical protein